MQNHEFWVFVHIVLFVYWLGADVGVFVLARRAKDPTLAFSQRSLLLEMAMKIDFTPRIAFVLMLPVGVQLAWNLGLLHSSALLPAMAWAVAGFWLALVLVVARNPAASPLLQRVLSAWLLILATAMFTASALGMWTDTLLSVPWLTGKLALYGVICLLALGIDYAFKPVGAGFAELAARGSSEQLEARISSGIDATIRVVVALYLALLLAAFLGTVKPLG